MLKRWKIERLKRELERRLAADRAAREGETTREMADAMVDATRGIVKLQKEIRELEGEEPEDSGGFEDRLPSGMFVPQKGEK
jgi:hypothetical protein